MFLNFLLLTHSILICFCVCFPVSNSTQSDRKEIKANVKLTLNQIASMGSFRSETCPLFQLLQKIRGRELQQPVYSEQSRSIGDSGTDRSTTRHGEQFVLLSDVNAKPSETSSIQVVSPFKPRQSPECAEGLTYCESIEDYPETYIEKILQNAIDNFQELLGTDELKSSPIEQRVDANDGKDNSLCTAIEQIVYPKTAMTKDGKWLYVVNHASHVQGVRVEQCLKTSDDPVQSCLFTESFPMGYKTSCKQKYIYRKLVALDEDGKQITDIFQLPSCCSCSIITNGKNSRREGFRKISSKSK